jgi:hypothetical protein
MEAARKNAEKQQQYAQQRGERRQQRLARQGKDEESKAEESKAEESKAEGSKAEEPKVEDKEEKPCDHDAKGKQKVELTIQDEDKSLTQAAQDEQPQEPQTEPGSKQEDSHIHTHHQDDEQEPATTTPQIERFHEFFNRILSLANTLDTAIDVLSPAMLHQLSEEIDNDWAIEDMDQMVRGVIANARRMNYDRWDKGGGKWKKGSVQARNYERPVDSDHEEQIGDESEQHGEPVGADAEFTMEE